MLCQAHIPYNTRIEVSLFHFWCHFTKSSWCYAYKTRSDVTSYHFSPLFHYMSLFIQILHKLFTALLYHELTTNCEISVMMFNFQPLASYQSWMMIYFSLALAGYPPHSIKPFVPHSMEENAYMLWRVEWDFMQWLWCSGPLQALKTSTSVPNSQSDSWDHCLVHHCLV